MDITEEPSGICTMKEKSCSGKEKQKSQSKEKHSKLPADKKVSFSF